MSTNIKKARENAGLSQKHVALSLHVSSPTVSDWEAGKIMPSAKNLLQLSKLLQVSTDYLLGREDINKRLPSGDGTSSFQLTAEEQAFLEKLRRVEQVNPEMLDLLESMIDNMLK